MSATTIRGSSPAEEIYSGNYPLAQRGVLIGFPYTGPLHTLGYWQSDNAVDIYVAVGTDVVAVADGTVRARGDWSVPYNLALSASGWDLLLFGDDGGTYFYARLSQRFVADGEHVVQGQVIGKSGGATSVPHLHVAVQPQPVNQVPNPSFEYDALGAAPVSWVKTGTVNWASTGAVFQVQNAWATQGGQSLLVATPTMSSSDVAQAVIDTGASVGGVPVFSVTPGQQFAVRADVNITAVAGKVTLYSQVDWYGPTGSFLSTSLGLPVGGTPSTVTPYNVIDGGGPIGAFVDNYDGGTPSTVFTNSVDGASPPPGITTGGTSSRGLVVGVAQLVDLYTAPAGAGLAKVSFTAVSSQAGSSLSYYIDAVLVARPLPGPVANAVPDPSFEYDTVGGAPAAWVSSNVPPWLNTGATLTVTSGSPAVGAHQFLTVAAGPGSLQGAGTTVLGPFIAGQPYTFSAWLQGAVGGEDVEMDIGVSGDSQAHRTAPLLTTSWVRYSVTWTPSTTEASANIAIRSSLTSAQTWRIDGAQVAPGSAPGTYVDGDTPGFPWTGTPGQSPSALPGTVPGYSDSDQPTNPQILWG